MRHLLRVDDLRDEDVEFVVERSMSLAAGGEPAPSPTSAVVGLLFLSPSLRTRVGFAVASRLLGAHPLDVAELRYTAGSMSSPESFEHTVRTVSGMVDLLVVRAPVDLPELDLRSKALCPVINGGDLYHHPTQALIDLVAIRAELNRPATRAKVGLVGDLNQRAVRSLVDLTERGWMPALRLITPPSRSARWSSLGLMACTTIETMDVDGLDVLYMAGLPAVDSVSGDELSATERERYALTVDVLGRLRRDAVVLSPLPVIDEIHAESWADPRIRVFPQSDRGVLVRRAILELLLGS